MKIARALPINDGKQIEVQFADNSAYRFHAAWMRDSSPSLVGSDYYRKSAKEVFSLDTLVAKSVEISEDGQTLLVHFHGGSVGEFSDGYVASWLHAFAPHVGQCTSGAGAAEPEPVQGTGSLFDDLLVHRRPWDSTMEMPMFTAKELEEDQDKMVEFLERMIDPGVALVTDVPPPSGLELEVVGFPLERLVSKVVGRLNQHPVRATNYGYMHTRTPEGVAVTSDYDHSNPLSMHNDHTVYNGTPGFLQYMYQAQGHVTSKVCDGLAISQYFKENHPAEYELLTTVNVTHSSRNTIYSKKGSYRTDMSPNDEGAVFELVHTHPVIQLDANGAFEKVVQSETKRGVCALPFDDYDRYMAAYRLWARTVEEPRWVKCFPFPEGSVVCLNNFRCLHGRAIVPAGMTRCMVFGYQFKTIAENRYRLLRQLQAERRNPQLSDRWLTRVPNQVLGKMVNGMQ